MKIEKKKKKTIFALFRYSDLFGPKICRQRYAILFLNNYFSLYLFIYSFVFLIFSDLLNTACNSCPVIKQVRRQITRRSALNS